MVITEELVKLAELIPIVKTLRGLPDRVERLERRLAELEASKAPDKDFAECRGALFKRKAGGGWQNAVYCPNCKTSTQQFPGPNGGMIFVCRSRHCGWGSMFTVTELPGVMKELPD